MTQMDADAGKANRVLNVTAFQEGLKAGRADDESEDGQMTDCPYAESTDAHADWWKGYHFYGSEEHMAARKIATAELEGTKTL